MKRACGWAVLSMMWALQSAGPAAAQDWTTLGNDAQRSAWLRSSAKIAPSSVRSPDFGLLWKHELDAEARGDSSLSAPVLLDFLISHKGFRSLAFLGAADGSVFAIDTDLDRPEWERRFGVGAQYPAPTADCPGGMTTSLSRPTAAALPGLGGFSGPRRRSPGFSGVGEPNQGAVTLKKESSTPARRAAGTPKRSPRVQAPQARVLRGLSVVYALTADGMLRTLLVSNGYDHGSPMPFLPANANAKGLMVVDGVAFAATLGGCNGVADGVWALNTETGKVSSWKAGSGKVVGMNGYAMGPDGTVYVSTDDGRIVALAAGTLEQKTAHKGSAYVSSPVVIDYEDQDYLAVARKDGSIALFEAAKLAGGPVSATPADSAGFASDALATWTDRDNVTWVLAPKSGAVEAWKIVKTNGKPALQSGWKASIASPLPPIIVDGVIFAAASGKGSSPATLYALDGATGKTLWDSGKTITAPAAKTGLTAGPATIYLPTRDGALYAFGFSIEH